MAAGHGTRMRSSLPKVLHPVCGQPMLGWVINAAKGAGAARIVCVARDAEQLGPALPDGVEAVEQSEGEGTGTAVLAAREAIDGARSVVVLSGDHPLISARLIEQLTSTHEREQAAATVLTTESLDPAGYGRVVRSEDGTVERIVETKHAENVPDEELAIREINVGTYVFDGRELVNALDRVAETGGERYLTDVFPLLREGGKRIAAHTTEDVASAIGVNSRADLIEVERLAHTDIVRAHALAGVSFVLPHTSVIEAGVAIGEDTVIEPGTSLLGATTVGRDSRIGPHSTLVDATVGDGVAAAHSYLTECEVKNGATIGPFAHIRPKTVVGENAKVGTFVETKNADVGAGAKVPHLTYLGDADVGEGANIGAGTITANYDGRTKHRTEIGAGVKTGVHTSLVAPVTVGDRAYTGAGSVITEDVPAGALGISRPEQTNVEGYSDRVEKEAQ